jgi:hypothetical protein
LGITLLNKYEKDISEELSTQLLSISKPVVPNLFSLSTVTYSRVLFTMELYCTPKSQHTTVKHSQQLFEHTYTSNLYGLVILTLIEFFQQDLLWQSSNMNSHSCSQSLQTHVRTIYHPAIGPFAHHSSSSAYSPSLTAMINCLHRPRYKLTCFYRNFPIRTQSSNQQESVAKRAHTHTRLDSRDFQTRLTKSTEVQRQQNTLL